MKFNMILRSMCMFLFLVLISNNILCNESDIRKIEDFDKLYVDKYIKFYQTYKIDSAKISDREGYKKLIKYIIGMKYEKFDYLRIINILHNYALISSKSNVNFYNYDVTFIFRQKKDKIKLVFLRDETIIDTNLVVHEDSGDYFVFEPMLSDNIYKRLSRNIFIRHSLSTLNVIINIKTKNVKKNIVLESFCQPSNNYKIYERYQYYKNLSSDDILFMHGVFQLIIYLESRNVFTDFWEKYLK
ncbi:MAG: hypothetical protein V1779_12015 [bacterium]